MSHPTFASSVPSDFFNPMTAPGDIIVGGAAGTPTRLAQTVTPGNLIGVDSTSGLTQYVTGLQVNSDPRAIGPGSSYIATSTSAYHHLATITAVTSLAYNQALALGGVDSAGTATNVLTLYPVLTAGNVFTMTSAAAGSPAMLAVSNVGGLNINTGGGPLLVNNGAGTASYVLTSGGAATPPTWAAAPSALVASVFGRTGAVAAVTADYTPAQVGAVSASVMTTVGDLIIGGAAGAAARLGAGTASYVLTSGGAATPPTWAAAPGVSWPLTYTASMLFEPNNIASAALTLTNDNTLSVNGLTVHGSIAGNPVLIAAAGSTNTGLTISSAGTGSFTLNTGATTVGFSMMTAGITAFEVLGYGGASAVNYLTVTNAATATAPILTFTGSDTNVSGTITPKGAGVINITGGATSVPGNALSLAGVSNAVNYLTVTNSVTGNTPNLTATGTDTNIGVNVATKGSGTFTVNGSGVALVVSGSIQTTNIGGLNNTAVGIDALFSGGAASDNVAMGYGALYYTTGGHNTAIGYNAGTANIGGYQNTAIGWGAQQTGSAWNCATAIGAATSAGASGAVAIGADNTGTGASTAVANTIALGTALHTILVGTVITATPVSSAVNHLSVTNAIAANPVLITATGSTNTGLTISSTGAGSLNLNSGSTSGGIALQSGGIPTFQTVGAGGTPVNYIYVENALTGSAPKFAIFPAGSDANVSIALIPKGTGSVSSSGGWSTAAITSGSLPTQAFVSGTAAQILTTRDVDVVQSVTFTPLSGSAATCAVALSPDNVTYSTVGTMTVPAGLAMDSFIDFVTLTVPAGWYLRMTLVNATFTANATYY